MEVTKEWAPFDGDYEKDTQDIKLRNGDVVTLCWPNAGFWRTLRKEGNEKYYDKKIPLSDVEFVRLNHDEY